MGGSWRRRLRRCRVWASRGKSGCPAGSRPHGSSSDSPGLGWWQRLFRARSPTPSEQDSPPCSLPTLGFLSGEGAQVWLPLFGSRLLPTLWVWVLHPHLQLHAWPETLGYIEFSPAGDGLGLKCVGKPFLQGCLSSPRGTLTLAWAPSVFLTCSRLLICSHFCSKPYTLNYLVSAKFPEWQF